MIDVQRISSSEPLPHVGTYFDAVAPGYNQDAQGWKIHELLQHTIGCMEPHERDFIDTTLDVGAGTGLTIEAMRAALGERATPPHTVAVDASRKMLDLLIERFPDHSVTPVHGRIEDYLNGLTRDFDLVTSIGATEFLPNLPDTLAALAGRLTVGGHMIFAYIPGQHGIAPVQRFSTPEGVDYAEYSWPRGVIEAQLRESGLTLLERYLVDAYQRETDGVPETVLYDFVAARRPA
jgi:predicted TPR repeat methyltransferase